MHMPTHIVMRGVLCMAMAYIATAYVVMACTIMAYMAMACIFVAGAASG